MFSCGYLLKAGLQNVLEARRNILGQYRTRTIFLNTSILQHEYVVSTLYGSKAKCYDDTGSTLEEFIHSALDQAFCRRIKTRCGLIKDDQVGIRKEDTRKRQQLRFTR